MKHYVGAMHENEDIEKGLTLSQLDHALDSHQDEQFMKILKQLGLGDIDIVRIMCLTFATLLGMFTFLFFGVVAFTTPSEFSSSVSAILPVLTGVGLYKSKFFHRGFGISLESLKTKIQEALNNDSPRE
eukprot:m.2600 g.2600  ORF g.2600 m.2600 type:complete len:129 (+) comp2552_c0_seq1:355-741(+)